MATACVALPRHQTPPPPSLPSHVLDTRIAQYGPSPLFTFHAHARTEHCRDLDLHMHTRLKWWLIPLGGGGDITSIETERWLVPFILTNRWFTQGAEVMGWSLLSDSCFWCLLWPLSSKTGRSHCESFYSMYSCDAVVTAPSKDMRALCTIRKTKFHLNCCLKLSNALNGILAWSI